jgi:hypothetical protein
VHILLLLKYQGVTLISEHWFLRWRFEYSDGKPPKYGQWDRHGDFASDQAWSQDKTNLLYACIEAKGSTSREVKVIHRCPGADFVNFNWIATASAPLNLKGSITPIPRIVGLMLIDRKQKHQFFSSGATDTFDHGKDYGVEHLTGFGR